jgi:DNA-binding response OmpR family regulator
MRRAYVIDDDPDTAESLKMILELEGFGVATFHDCDAALPVVQNGNPCVLFLDLKMPGTMRIEDFLRKMREIHPKSSIYILSGTHDCGEAAKRLGADGWLRKPYEPDEVARIAEMHCPRKQ